MDVLLALLAMLGLAIAPVVVRVLRRGKRAEPAAWVGTSPYATERADTELAERTAAQNRELVAEDYAAEIAAFDEWARKRDAR